MSGKKASKSKGAKAGKSDKAKAGKRTAKTAAKVAPTEACREVAKALAAAYPELAADENSPLNWAIKVLTAAAGSAKQ